MATPRTALRSVTTLFDQAPSRMGVIGDIDQDSIFDIMNPAGALGRTAFDMGLFPRAQTAAGGFVGEINDILQQRARQGQALFRLREALGGRFPQTASFQDFMQGFARGLFQGGTQPIGQFTLSGLLDQIASAAQDNPNEALNELILGANDDPGEFVRLLMDLVGLRGIDPLAARSLARRLGDVAANWLQTLGPEERAGTNFVQELLTFMNSPANRPQWGSTGVSR